MWLHSIWSLHSRGWNLTSLNSELSVSIFFTIKFRSLGWGCYVNAIKTASGEHLVFEVSFCTDSHWNVRLSLTLVPASDYQEVTSMACFAWESFSCFWPQRASWGQENPSAQDSPQVSVDRLCRYGSGPLQSHGQQRPGSRPLVLQIYLKFAAHWGPWKKRTKPQSWRLAIFQIFN